jgi:hypothetical protein
VLKKLPIALALVAITAGVALSGPQTNRPELKVTMSVPERTDLGEWDGTWWYKSRDRRMAIWLRTVDGMPEFKIKFVSLRQPEGFETDWNGVSDYITKGDGVGRFELHATQRDANSIKGRWDWALEKGTAARKQRGDVTLYRAGNGRSLVVHFDSCEIYIGPRDQPENWRPIQESLTFRKASKRLVRWEELPF